MYGAEIWSMKSKLLTIEMNARSRNKRKSKLMRLKNYYMRHWINALGTIADRIHQKILIWHGHLNRLPEESCPKQLFQQKEIRGEDNENNSREK